MIFPVPFLISQHSVTIAIGILDSRKKTSSSSILFVKERALIMTEGSCDLSDRTSGHKSKQKEERNEDKQH